MSVPGDDAPAHSLLASDSPEGRPDAFAGTIPHPLDTVTLRHLSQISPWRSVYHLVQEWAFILGAAWLCSLYWHPLLYLATVVWIGARQHALAILVHEGAHYRLFSDRRWNDWVSEVLLAWPILGTMRSYRASHWPHHRFVNTDADPDWLRKQGPDWQFPMSRRHLWTMLLLDLSGLNTLQLLGRVKAHSRTLAGLDTGLGFRFARVAFYLAMAGLFTWWHLWLGVMLFWFIPGFTWLKLSLRVRSIAEHYAFVHAPAGATTRTTLPRLWERWLIAPKHINYHVEHHLYPSVPHFRLPDLHAALMAQPGYRERTYVTESYTGVLHECLQRPPAP